MCTKSRYPDPLSPNIALLVQNRVIHTGNRENATGGTQTFDLGASPRMGRAVGAEYSGPTADPGRPSVVFSVQVVAA